MVPDSIVRICKPDEEQCKKLADEVGNIQELRDATVVSAAYGAETEHGHEESNNFLRYRADGTCIENDITVAENKARIARTKQMYEAGPAWKRTTRTHLLPSAWARGLALVSGENGTPVFQELNDV